MHKMTKNAATRRFLSLQKCTMFYKMARVAEQGHGTSPLYRPLGRPNWRVWGLIDDVNWTLDQRSSIGGHCIRQEWGGGVPTL